MEQTIVELSYTNFISIVNTKHLPFDYKNNSKSDDVYYHLFSFDGPIKYVCDISDIDNETDITNFEDNYKDTKTGGSVIKYDSSTKASIVAPTLDDVMGLYPKKRSLKGVVPFGTTKFFDTLVESEKRICGGEYWVKNSDVDKIHEDDYIEFSIIDKNDILGLFSTYGLTAGTDILELVKFVYTDYIQKGNPLEGFHSILYEGIKGTNAVVPGLFMRMMCKSHGIQDFGLVWRMYFYE